MAQKQLDNFDAQLKGQIEQLPESAQNIFIAAFNSAQENGMAEGAARQVAWNSIKEQYQQGADGKWAKKPDEPGIHYKPTTSGGN